MKKLRVGIIGCGRVAGLLEDDDLRSYLCTHMGGYRQHKLIKVVACCSREPEDAQFFADKFSIPSVYTNYKKMLKDEKLDIVSVAAYAPTRAAMVRAAARSGVKGIFCEKAMATSLKEADSMIRACKKAGTRLLVNHTRRWDHQYLGAKEIIDRGDLGTIQTITGTFSGNLLHTGVHMFDAFDFFCGPVRSVAGTIHRHAEEHDESSGYQFKKDLEAEIGEEIEDEDGVAHLEFKNGVIGTVYGLGKKYFVFEIDVQGTEGRLRIGNGLFEFWKTAESKHYSNFKELALVSKIVPGTHPPGMVGAVEDLVTSIKKKRDPRCSGRDARRSLEVALAIYASDAAGGVPIALPLAQTGLRIASR